MKNNKKIKTPAQNLIFLLKEMNDLLTKETILLRDFKISEAGSLQERKHELIDMIEEAKKHISLDPKIIAGLTGEEKKELEMVSNYFSEVMLDNYRELRKAREVNRKIVEFIASATSTHYKRSKGYNSKGGTGNIASKPHETVPPISINSVI